MQFAVASPTNETKKSKKCKKCKKMGRLFELGILNLLLHWQEQGQDYHHYEIGKWSLEKESRLLEQAGFV